MRPPTISQNHHGGDDMCRDNLPQICCECGLALRVKRHNKNRDGSPCASVYCSRACYNRARAAVVSARVNTCRFCEKPFIYSAGKKDDSVFCSLACRNQSIAPDPCKCITCGVMFSALQIRTNQPCGKWYVRLSDRSTCSVSCLRRFYREGAERKAKISKAFQREKHPNWQGGTHELGSRGPGWQAIAEKCRELHRRACKHCRMEESESIAKGWGRLQVNHITPFHQQLNKEAANKQSNLEALCKSCHTRADWAWRKNNPVQLSLAIFR